MKFIPIFKNALLSLVVAFSCGSLLAQTAAGTPRFEQPRQSGGGSGLGVGLSIDLGSLISAIKNALTSKDEQKKDNQDKPPVLQKTATNVSSGSSGNYTIDWVVQYANNTGATLPSVSVKDGPIATIINPSLIPNLVPQQGWTGTTNGNVPVDNYALFSGTNIEPHGVMTAAFPAANSGGAIGAAGHDGYIPIPYNSTNFGRRIYMFNHGSTSGLNFQCAQSSGGICPGWPKSAPVGDGSGENFLAFSNLVEEHAIDNGRIYYAVNKASNYTFGIACFNLETEQECGYTPLGRTKVVVTPSNNFPNANDVSSTPMGLATKASLASDILLKGPWQVGGELYWADFNGTVYCAKTGVTLSPCIGGYALPIMQIRLTTPAYNPNYARSGSVAFAFNQYVMGRVVNGNLYLTSSTRQAHLPTPTTPFDKTSYINCLNPATKTACWSGTTPTKGTGAMSSYVLGNNVADSLVTMAPLNNFIAYDTNGNAKGLCQYIRSSNLPFSKKCFDLVTGGVYTPSANMTAQLPSPPTHGYGTEVHIWPRTYLPEYATEKVRCWDWSTDSLCDSTSSGYFAQSALQAMNYALNADDQLCVWAYGDKGVLWNFDPKNLDANGVAKPCGGSGKFNRVFQPLQYCSGPKPFHWTSVEVKGAPLANYDKFIIKVIDSANNTVLLTKDLKASGQLLTNITGIDVQTLSQPLKIEVEYSPKAGMGGSDKPVLEVRYKAPPQEFCFKSTHTCEQGKITNSIEAPDATTPGKLVTVKVDVEKPQSCPVNPPPPVCGTATTPACPTGGDLCGQLGQPACPIDTSCVPGTFNCPVIVIDRVCALGDPLCDIVRPPPRKRVCLTGDCPDNPPQSVGHEYKELKVACVRKPKQVEPTEVKKVVTKPKPKPPVVKSALPVDASAVAAAPKPKPRPKPAKPKPAVHEDDCE